MSTTFAARLNRLFDTVYPPGRGPHTSAEVIAALKAEGIAFRYASPTNQQFPILPDHLLESLRDRYSFSFWEKVDESHSAVRFCTSWATRQEHVEQLIRDIRQYTQSLAG